MYGDIRKIVKDQITDADSAGNHQELQFGNSQFLVFLVAAGF